MKKIFLFFLPFIVFHACSSDKSGEQLKTKKEQSPIKIDSIQPKQHFETNSYKKFDTTDFHGFLQFFESINIDKLHVFYKLSSEANTNYPFEGIAIDKTLYHLLPENSGDYFACYKFIIDSSNIGLILRTPSEYVNRRISLFIYNTAKNEYTENFILADEYGDDFVGISYESWLYINMSAIKCFVKQKNTTGDDSFNPVKWTQTTELYDYKFENGKLVQSGLDSVTLTRLNKSFSKIK